MVASIHALRMVLAVACLLLGHAAILHGAYAMAIGLGLAYACVNVAIVWLSRGMRSLRTPWLVPVLLLLGAQIAVWLGYTSAVAVVLAPSIVLNLLLLLMFGHTLLPGREPLITRFRRLEFGHVAPIFVSYTRGLTMAWTLLFAVATAASVAAAAWGDFALWSWISFIGVPAASLSLFLGEHIYRAVRYGPEGCSSPLRTVRILLHPDAWPGNPIPQAQLHGSRND